MSMLDITLLPPHPLPLRAFPFAVYSGGGTHPPDVPMTSSLTSSSSSLQWSLIYEFSLFTLFKIIVLSSIILISCFFFIFLSSMYSYLTFCVFYLLVLFTSPHERKFRRAGILPVFPAVCPLLRNIHGP